MRATRLVILVAFISCTAMLWGQAAPTTPAAPTPAQDQNPAAPAQTQAPQSDRVVVEPADPPANTELLSVDRDKNKTRSVPADSLRPSPLSGSFSQVLDRVVEREQIFLQNLRQYQPMVETYMQYMKPDKELGAVPANDKYFLGRLELQSGHTKDVAFIKASKFKNMWEALTSVFNLRFSPLGYAQMVMPDNGGFNKSNYEFQFVRREFVGDLRCLVIDVRPRQKNAKGRFLGRIWVEDRDYNIVRFNGTYTNAGWFDTYLHFDSWRLNMQPGVWLPAFIYSEETDLKPHIYVRSARFKAQTRLWGYAAHNLQQQVEHTSVMVDDAQVKDQSEQDRDAMPVEAQRLWERQAEQNVLDRLTRAGMLAEPGEVDKILETVVNNLEVTSGIDIQPPVRCRVLLTTPMESFTVGHTIVLSRGLIDVLPDEPTLAAFLAHELAHIALAHRMDTQYAFVDRMIFPDEAVYRKLHFHKDGSDERAADDKAMAILQSSPYKDKLGSVGLFLRMLELRRKELPQLVAAHLGNSPIAGDYRRLKALEASAPALKTRDVTQLPALPIGSRIHVDPFYDRLELNKAKAVPLLSAREKMSFEVTPVFPYLTRAGDGGTPVATAPPAVKP